LYGCKIWSLSLWEEHRVKVFKKRVLRRMVGHKREEVAAGWRKIHNFCSSPNILRVIKSKKVK